MKDESKIEIYKFDDDPNSVSLKKIFKSVQCVYNDYHETTDLFRNIFACDNYLSDYYLSYYDYENDRLVVGKRNVFNIFYDESIYYIKDKNEITFIKEGGPDKEQYTVDDERAQSVLDHNRKLFEDAFVFYDNLREYKTIKAVKVPSTNSNILVSIRDFGIILSPTDSEGNILASIELRYNNNKIIEADDKNIIFDFNDNQKYILRNVKVDRNKLPEWCRDAIDVYDREHPKLFINAFDRLFDKAVNKVKSKKIKTIEIDDKIKDVSGKIEEMVNEYSALNESKDDYDRVKIPKDLLFKNVDDHLEINKNYINNLKYIDLSDISFENVLVSGVDFTDTNISIFNPQNVYNKDLSFCTFADIDNKYNSIPFNFYTDFGGVNLCGTVILGDSDFKYNLDGAITDNNTKIINNHSVDKTYKRK